MSVLNSYTEVFKPVVAIIAYEGDKEGKQEWYLESHPIINGQMLEGKPLQQHTLHGMLALMYDKRQAELKMEKFIPENLIFADLLHGGDYKLVWYRREEVRAMFFTDGKKDFSAWVPPIVYVAERKKLSVFALKNNDRPTEETKLCSAPFFNVSGNGPVCLGSAKANKPLKLSYQNLMKYYEDLFWGSMFAGAPETWKKFIDDPNLKWNDTELLKECNNHPRTINDLMK